MAQKTWIVVADGAKAYVYIYSGPGEGLQKVEVLLSPRNAPDRSAGETALQRFARKKFSRAFVNMLKTEQQDFDHLVLAAPPTTLGDMRASLDEALRAKLLAEIDRDYTHHLPEDELAQRMVKILKNGVTKRS
ncbi:MAG: host attachment protein [Alphaproteobacteria bacterium]|nr:host attachment protein [Alphaproteobacteria bacterium]